MRAFFLIITFILSFPLASAARAEDKRPFDLYWTTFDFSSEFNEMMESLLNLDRVDLPNDVVYCDKLPHTAPGARSGGDYTFKGVFLYFAIDKVIAEQVWSLQGLHPLKPGDKYYREVRRIEDCSSDHCTGGLCPPVVPAAPPADIPTY